MSKYIMALDQGTTSSRCILFDKKGDMVSVVAKEFKQHYPNPGWVEHDANEIWDTQITVARQAMENAGANASDIAAIGITNQRETTVVWDRKTGEPVFNAIVWQCRRSAGTCDALRAKGLSDSYAEKTGLVIDAYFSGTKVQWILDNVPGVRARAEAGELSFGTIDTWLIWNLTKGKVHATDYSNASRTMMFNINNLQWDDDILKDLTVPKSLLPDVKPSSGLFGEADASWFGGPIPITGCAGDQQAALFGQTCFKPGQLKNTYGTACCTLMNTGEKRVASKNGLITTIAWGVDGKVEYALEGSIFMGGASVQWLRDELKLVNQSPETEAAALAVSDTGGVYVVPAHVGLGAPHWDSYARGSILGMTRGTNRNHIIRATLEGIAFQVYDVMKAMAEDSGIELDALRADGGASANNFLMQFQADVLNIKVQRPVCIETTALGASYLAGLAVGYWENKDEVVKNWQISQTFDPSMDEAKRKELIEGWDLAVSRSKEWIKA